MALYIWGILFRYDHLVLSLIHIKYPTVLDIRVPFADISTFSTMRAIHCGYIRTSCSTISRNSLKKTIPRNKKDRYIVKYCPSCSL